MAEYPGGIYRVTWSYSGMPRNEQVSDAVILKPLKPPVVVPDSQAPAYENDPARMPRLSQFMGALRVMMGNTPVYFTRGFDSGDVRGLRIALDSGSTWYGGGERSLPMNRYGQRIPFYNNPHYGYSLNAVELNYSVPLLMSPGRYGLLFDNPAKGYADIGRANPRMLEVGFAGGRVDVYVIPGANPDEVLRNYTALTGRQPLPPRWAFGNFVSRFGYRSRQQVEETVARMKAEMFPVDAAIIDIFWFGDSIQGTLGNLDFVNKKAWPEPEKMLAGFRKQQVNPILVTEPFVLKNTRQFAASQPHLATDSSGKPFMLTDFYFGYGGLLDLFKPTARQWFWQHYKKWTDLGVAGWWGDLGEPEKHPAGILHDLSSMGAKRKMAADEVHNLYGHMWSKMIYENWTKTYPNRRLFYLNRAGYAGSQRYSIFPWTGDVARSWDGLRAQLPILQSMSLSGVPYIHSDAGGFSMTDDDDQELYVRWLQMAAFTPILRPHGTALGPDLTPPGVIDMPSEPVYKQEPYKNIARTVIHQRYQLLPYHYGLAWEAATMGRPFIRPMTYYGITDSALLQATDQYMYGDAFLVAPVLAKGEKLRNLYLPKVQWYNLENNRLREGGSWIADTTALETMPVYVKAGSFVPHWDEIAYQNTTQYSLARPITIRYYPGKFESSYTFFDDAGEGRYAFSDSSKYQLVEFSGASFGSTITLSITPRVWPKGTVRRVVLELPVDMVTGGILPTNKPITQVLVNGKPVAMSGGTTTYPQARWQGIEIECRGVPELVEVKM